MSYNISTLFGNYYAGSNSGSVYSSLADYSSIKNGSYRKLVSAYYDKSSAKGTAQTSVTDKIKKQTGVSDTKVYTGIKADADALSEAALKLTDTTQKSLFKTADTVTDDIVSAVKDYVKAYNSLVDSSGASVSSNVSSKVTNLTRVTDFSSDKLADIGITIQDDKSLKLDEDILKNSDISKVKNLFNGSSSLAYQTMTRATSIGQSAQLAGSCNTIYGSDGTCNGSFLGSSYNWYL